MKTCPACAEEVQDAARVCRHCGYDFRKRRAPRTYGEIAKLAVGGCLLVLLGPIAALLFLAWLGGM